MQHSCPLCGSALAEAPFAILPERGMVVANGRFAVLTGQESALLARLAEVFPRIVAKEALLEWMYQLSTDEQPEIKIVDVFVCKLRKKLKPLGVRIDTAWGRGYALAADAKPTIIREAA
jgi:DNA-binding response OmpR family regulator